LKVNFVLVVLKLLAHDIPVLASAGTSWAVTDLYIKYSRPLRWVYVGYILRETFSILH
jgi:hypothetical protein